MDFMTVIDLRAAYLTMGIHATGTGLYIVFGANITDTEKPVLARPTSRGRSRNYFDL
jgi:hypothetical protein